MDTAAVVPLSSRNTLVLFTSVGCMNLNSASTRPVCAVNVFFADTSVVVLVSLRNTLRFDELGVPAMRTVPPPSEIVYVDGVLPTEVLLKLVSVSTAALAEAAASRVVHAQAKRFIWLSISFPLSFLVPSWSRVFEVAGPQVK